MRRGDSHDGALAGADVLRAGASFNGSVAIDDDFRLCAGGEAAPGC